MNKSRPCGTADTLQFWKCYGVPVGADGGSRRCEGCFDRTEHTRECADLVFNPTVVSSQNFFLPRKFPAS